MSRANNVKINKINGLGKLYDLLSAFVISNGYKFGNGLLRQRAEVTNATVVTGWGVGNGG